MLKTCLVFLFIFYSFSSSVLGQVILAEEAQEMLDDHIKQSALLQVPMPTDKRIIKDYERYKDYRVNTLARNFHFTNYMWNEKNSKGKLLTKEVCMDIVAEYRVPTTPIKEEEDFKKCLNHLL